jgi:hypothetical protein
MSTFPLAFDLPDYRLLHPSANSVPECHPYSCEDKKAKTFRHLDS